MTTPSTASHWHAVTPQTRPLTLSILELTPLALTLSLTLAPPTHALPGHLTTQHTAHIHNHTHGPGRIRKKIRQRRIESDDELTAVEPDDDISALPGSYPIVMTGDANFKDLLSHGVVVSVNGQPWSRIVAHVSDPDDDEPYEGQEHEIVVEAGEEGEWEDDSDHATEEGITRRRPRKARFSLSASSAIRDAGDKDAIRGKWPEKA